MIILIQKVKKYLQYFIESNIDGFDLTNGIKCSDTHRFEKLNSLSINIFELNLYRDKNKWKHNLRPIEINKNESDRVVDLLFCKSHYALIEKLKNKKNLGDHHKSFLRRRCLISYTTENMLKIHKPKCESIDKTTIRTSPESHLHWKDHFHKNPL